MIVYNTTFHIEKEHEHAAISYLKSEFIPKAIASGFLHHPHLFKIMHDSEDEGVNVSVQFHVKNIDTLNYWLQQEGRFLHQALVAKFGSSVAGFSTLLEEIALDL